MNNLLVEKQLWQLLILDRADFYNVWPRKPQSPSVKMIMRENGGHSDGVRLEESTRIGSRVFLIPVAYRQPNPNKLRKTKEKSYTST